MKQVVRKLPSGFWWRYCQDCTDQAYSDSWSLTLHMALAHIKLRHTQRKV